MQSPTVTSIQARLKAVPVRGTLIISDAKNMPEPTRAMPKAKEALRRGRRNFASESEPAMAEAINVQLCFS